MEKYESLEMEVIRFDHEDIVTASCNETPCIDSQDNCVSRVKFSPALCSKLRRFFFMKRFLSVVLIFIAILSSPLSPDTVPLKSPESDDVEISSSGTETPIIDF